MAIIGKFNVLALDFEAEDKSLIGLQVVPLWWHNNENIAHVNQAA